MSAAAPRSAACRTARWTRSASTPAGRWPSTSPECGGDPEAIRARRRFLEPARLRAFLELHIEQAPSLVEAGKPLAVCTGIPGNFRYPSARIEGRNEHVGLPRRFRRDAAMAGADFATALDRAWEEHEARGVPMAATLGRFHTDAALHGMTFVPGLLPFQPGRARLRRGGAGRARPPGGRDRRARWSSAAACASTSAARRAPRSAAWTPASRPRSKRGASGARPALRRTRQPRLARRRRLRRGRRADGDAVRAQPERQPQSGGGDGAGRLPPRHLGAGALAGGGALRSLDRRRIEGRVHDPDEPASAAPQPLEGIPQAHHSEVTENSLGSLAEGRYRGRNAYLSVDPAMRGWVSTKASYSTPVGACEVMRADTVVEVEESHPDYAPASSGISWLSAPACGASSSSTTPRASRTRSRSSRADSARASSATAKTSCWTASSTPRARSPASTAARTWASG